MEWRYRVPRPTVKVILQVCLDKLQHHRLMNSQSHHPNASHLRRLWEKKESAFSWNYLFWRTVNQTLLFVCLVPFGGGDAMHRNLLLHVIVGFTAVFFITSPLNCEAFLIAAVLLNTNRVRPLKAEESHHPFN